MNGEKRYRAMVREFLHGCGYYDDARAIIEENTTSDEGIRRLLSVIPPELSQKRYPDFILRIRDRRELLIVLETREGRGAAQMNPNEDGTMIYSAALAQAYDVLTVAVRESESGLYKIEHFFQRCKDRFYRKVFGDKILTLAEYLEGLDRAQKEHRLPPAKLIVGAPIRPTDSARAVVTMEMFLIPPKFVHRFMENREICLVRRKEKRDTV